jgi:hypothetical protein
MSLFGDWLHFSPPVATSARISMDLLATNQAVAARTDYVYVDPHWRAFNIAVIAEAQASQESVAKGVIGGDYHGITARKMHGRDVQLPSCSRP